ncbi:MAG: MBL fold metallo-hydrolase [Gemmataceae bacterium]
MQLTMLPSAFAPGGDNPHQFLTSYVVNGTLAVDCGSLGFCRPPAEQALIRHILVTHSHIDHVASLPIFVENTYDPQAPAVVVHGSAAALDSLRRDLFNGRIWADFVALSPADAPFLRLEELPPGKTVELEGLRVTPVEVDHTVPTCGYILEDGSTAVIITSDTGPTAEIWERANRLATLKAVFLEVSFPDRLADLAVITKHLTPASFGREVKKLTRPARVIAVHLKSRFYAEIVAELSALGLSNVEVVQPGHVYDFR